LAVPWRSEKLTEEVFKFLRTAGPTLSAFNAWVLLKGLETLKIRIEAQSAKALQLARWLEAHPKVARVFYPGLALASAARSGAAQQKGGGAIVSFEVKGARERGVDGRRHCRLLSITANLGDTKTTITHPASTTHGRITPEARAAAGINEGLLRVRCEASQIGLEAVEDLQADLDRGKSGVGGHGRDFPHLKKIRRCQRMATRRSALVGEPGLHRNNLEALPMHVFRWRVKLGLVRRGRTSDGFD
jgi:O-succinylhomoserine sulfhydrylase